jgi:hypothetical protein
MSLDGYTKARTALVFDRNGVLLKTLSAPAAYGDSIVVRYKLEGGAARNLVVPLSPRFHISFGSLGWAYGHSAEYVIHILDLSGQLIRMENQARRVDVGSRERAGLAATATAEIRASGAQASVDLAGVPTVKPYYKSLTQTPDGQVWVELYQPAVQTQVVMCPPSQEFAAAPSGMSPCADGAPPRAMELWVEPLVYDVYDSRGVLRGRVRLPDGMLLEAARGHHVFLLERDGMDVATLWRYSVSFPLNQP